MIHHLVQVDEQYCHTLNNTCFVRVVHTDTGVSVIIRSIHRLDKNAIVFEYIYLKGVYHSSPETL